MERFDVANETEMRTLGARLARWFGAGDLVLLEGDLGAGKTTLVRGLLEGLGYPGAVRSPTFNLVQTFATTPPVMHADLYRVRGAEGIGLEDYFDTHLCLVEWPDRLGEMIDPDTVWRVRIAFAGAGRSVTVEGPA